MARGLVDIDRDIAASWQQAKEYWLKGEDWLAEYRVRKCDVLLDERNRTAEIYASSPRAADSPG